MIEGKMMDAEGHLRNVLGNLNRKEHWDDGLRYAVEDAEEFIDDGELLDPEPGPIVTPTLVVKRGPEPSGPPRAGSEIAGLKTATPALDAWIRDNAEDDSDWVRGSVDVLRRTFVTEITTLQNQEKNQDAADLELVILKARILDLETARDKEVQRAHSLEVKATELERERDEAKESAIKWAASSGKHQAEAEDPGLLGRIPSDPPRDLMEVLKDASELAQVMGSAPPTLCIVPGCGLMARMIPAGWYCPNGHRQVADL